MFPAKYYYIEELTRRLKAANIIFSSINAAGIILDGNVEIQNRPDVRAIVDQLNATNWLQIQQRIDDRKAAAKTEAAQVMELKNLTPAEATAWIDANIGDTATAANIVKIKFVLKLILRLLLPIRNELWADIAG